MPKSTPESGGACLRDWKVPEGWLRITTLDAHTAGEPLRVITGGYPELKGETILERRRYAQEHLGHLRTLLMLEPRGHREMYGCIVTDPVSPGFDFGVVFLHNEGYSTMCGHGIIAIATLAVETGMVPMVEPETTIRIDTPAGPVTAFVRVQGGRALSARFHNVPSFVVALDELLNVPGLGTIQYDLAFGGAYYAYVRADQVGVKCLPGEVAKMVDAGMLIKRALMQSRQIEHPFEKDLSFLYGTIFTAPPQGDADLRNVCIFADGQVDRSPTGTGVSGHMAIRFARGEVVLGQPFVIESIIGTTFTGRVVRENKFGSYRAVVPEVEGTAHITGRHEFLVDPADKWQGGFMI
jgi:proline racemase